MAGAGWTLQSCHEMTKFVLKESSGFKGLPYFIKLLIQHTLLAFMFR